MNEFERDVIDRLARMETRLETWTEDRPACPQLKNLIRAFWSALVIVILTLIPLAVVAITHVSSGK